MTILDDKHADEERKSVRFDLERVAVQTSVTKFNESGSEGEEDSDGSKKAEERAGGIVATLAARRATAVAKLQTVLNREGGPDFESCGPIIKKINIEPKKPQVVARRFVVENVSERDHLQQQESRSTDNEDEVQPNKFEKIKNIDLVLSRSDSEKTTPRSTDNSKMTFLEDLRRSKETMLDNMRKSESNHEEKIATSSLWMRSSELGNDSESVKGTMLREHEHELQDFRLELEMKLEHAKRELADMFEQQKMTLETEMKDRLSKLRKELTEKEELEIQMLVVEMDEARAESLKKARTELETCYEKERQDILTNLKSELDQRKRELLQLRSHEISKLEDEHERGLDDELTKQHGERVDNLRKELDKEFDDLRTELRAQQREKIARITEEHEKCLADILKDFKVDVSCLCLLINL